ncbi:hypothetical protein [Pirellula sp. SH-Sr6A]|uniref:hypothetical protein n=1 Tax=Pirellula sp. SH-Sr6A TaxID=1632865 RepID=UPI0011BA698E|nr:hypothetical protein [Pirellula sp. SH-Sr6A]
MHKYILLSQSEVGGRALQAWARLLALPDYEDTVADPIVFDERSHRLLPEISVYDYFIHQIESRIENHHGRCVTVLVDSVRPNDLSLVSDAATWETLIAMLVVTFPEFRWTFAYDGLPEVQDKSCLDRANFTEGDKTVECIFCWHNRYSIFHVWSDPLFDATGLRDWIRLKTNLDLERMSSEAGNLNAPFQLPRRRELSAVIEDELDYAMMHAYTTYRFGFRTDVVSSWIQMEERFHIDPTGNAQTNSGNTRLKLPIKKRHKYRVILEDMRLQFADKSAKKHLSRLEERGIHCNRLADENDDSDFRFMISTGQESRSDDIWTTNKGFLKNKSNGVGGLLSKPVGGPFELWRTAKLDKLLPDGVANGFDSPPAEIMEDLYDGHGAPGKLALVARKLIDRARHKLSNGLSVSDNILSAVLANDACELLGGKTPALSLEAIKIKHAAEVRAECGFVGAGFHFDLEDRLREINKFVHATCRWYHPSVRSYAELDARATICNELVKIYSDAGQSEEQDACLAHFRWNNRRLELLQSMAQWSLIGIALNSVLFYAEVLLVSLNRILFAFGLWIIVFCGITLVVNSLYATEQLGLREFPVLLATQLNWMIGGSANGISSLGKSSSDQELMLALVSIGANVVGVFHFGILISYFYSLISRK